MEIKKAFLLLLAVLVTAVAVARPVDPVTARRVAVTYMQSQGMKNATSLVDVTSETPFTEFYVFAAAEGGFILVSADDCVIPVLGYSVTSQFESKNIPEHVAEWYDDYEKMIRVIRMAKAGTSGEVLQQWQALSAGEIPQFPLTTAVSPMMTTTWNQSPYYNELCPYHDSTNARSVTGCVATATAQVMKYWNYPTTGYGSHTYTSERTKNGITYIFPNLTADFGATTYQWSDMPNALTATSDSTEINAVATLMYHIGVADEMRYSPVASGANNYNYYGTISRSSQTSLMKFFKYRSDMATLARCDYSDSVFSALLRAELDQNRPILFSGHDPSGGHSFVFDGYNNDGQFHVNWGWGGSYDGYYVIGDLHPSSGGTGSNSSHTFNLQNVALIGIRPNTDWSATGTTTVTVVSSGNGTVSGGGTYSFGDTVSLSATANAGYRFSGWSDGTKYNPREIIANGGSYTFTANFDTVAGDTLHYCPGNFCINSYGNSSNTTTWGIMIPASMLSDSALLSAVQLYVSYAGNYTLTVYTGDTDMVVSATASATYYENDVDQWQTIVLGSPVAISNNLWIIFTSDADYPASFTYRSGVAESFLWGPDFYAAGVNWDVTAMIKAIFSDLVVPQLPSLSAKAPIQSGVNADISFTASATPGSAITWSFPGGTPSTATGQQTIAQWSVAGIHQAIATATNSVGSVSDTVEVNVIDYGAGDTVSYCLDRPYLKSFGYGESTSWGIMIPSQYLAYRDTLKDVLFYILGSGEYTLNVYSGGSDAPDTLMYTQTFTFNTQNAYVHCILDSAMLIDKEQNLWITLSTTVQYPAAACEYSDEPNSDWIFTGTRWKQMHSWGENFASSWMLKAVTSSATLPTYNVTVNCVNRDGIAVDSSLVTGAGTYLEGDTVTLKGDTTSFAFWIVETGDTIYDNPYIFTIGSDRTITAVFGASESIDDVNISLLRLYPNPANERIYVRVLEQGEMVVIDATGRIVLRQNVGVGINVVDISAFMSGVYYVRIGSAKASFIINH